MATKLFVGGINYRTTDDGLKNAFAQAGEVVSARVISDKMTGRSRGFGFVEMMDKSAGMNAIDSLNNKEMDGRRLVVNEAKPKAGRY